MNLVKYIKETLEVIKFNSRSLRNEERKISFIVIISMFIPPIISLAPLVLINYLVTWRNTECVKMKLKDMDCTYSNYSTIKELLEDKSRTEKNVIDYNWEELRESIKKYKNLKPLIVKKFEGIYRIRDGNHRYITLKDLYGEDYEVNVKILNEKTNI